MTTIAHNQDPGCMHNTPCPVDTGPETEAICLDCALSHIDNGTDDKLEPAPQVDEVAPLSVESNFIPTPPINTLPAEILMRIFGYAQYLWRTKYMKKEKDDSPAIWDRSIRNQMTLGSPEVLSHVCSLWREIVLGSPVLWSQLDLYTLGRSPQMFLARCSAFVPRTQNQELILIARFRHCEDEPLGDCAAMREFCTSLSPRLRAFSIDNLAPNDAAFATSIIQATLPHTIPGMLTGLYIKDYVARTILTQRNHYDSDGLVGWELPTAETFGISQHLLDSIVRPIKSLRLRGQFFPWTSPAYHRLKELHLLCTRPIRGHRPFIRVPQLREILLACPELRILHININITGNDMCPVLTPVPLKDLEDLNLRGLSRRFYNDLLPLLAPGQKPLQLTFQTQPEAAAPLYCPTILSLLRRSNVTGLYILNRPSFDQYLNIDQFLAESPTKLRTLGLERIKISEVDLSQFDHLKRQPPIQVNCLCLRKCTIDLNALERLAEILPAQVLKLHEPEFLGVSGEDEIQVRERIAQMFPTVKWVRSSRDMELWDAWELEYID
ncbi:unnamed protein product [Rhizoctonia solani]|uniref:F-box domain-containing protein n=1 Tax=Rhizoctonia solani TaxID=456999 RepID=A0A8H3D2M5_9AGAM|nr:unnamed protein product [Rhizoctonia solani]